MNLPNFVARFACVASALACAGCSNEQRPEAPRAPGPWTRPLAERQADEFPRVFTNLAGEAYSVPRPPQRIASATLFTDVVLLAIGAKDRIAALHEVSKKPLFSSIAKLSQAFPNHVSSDPETVLAVRPDLVFLASFSDKRLDRLLNEPGRTVIRFDNLAGIPGVRESIRAVGYIVGRDAGAEQLVIEMDRRLDAVASTRSKRKGWTLLSWVDGFVAGRTTIFDDILGYVGAANLAARYGIEGAKRVPPERVLADPPDALVVGVQEGEEDAARQRLRRLVTIGRLPAVEHDRIVFVPNHLFLSTTHHVATMAEIIASKLDTWKKPR